MTPPPPGSPLLNALAHQMATLYSKGQAHCNAILMESDHRPLVAVFCVAQGVYFYFFNSSPSIKRLVKVTVAQGGFLRDFTVLDDSH